MELIKLIHKDKGIVALCDSHDKMKEKVKKLDHYWHHYTVACYKTTNRVFEVALTSYVQAYLL